MKSNLAVKVMFPVQSIVFSRIESKALFMGDVAFEQATAAVAYLESKGVKYKCVQIVL